jgi:hypothetical protein
MEIPPELTRHPGQPRQTGAPAKNAGKGMRFNGFSGNMAPEEIARLPRAAMEKGHGTAS